MSFIDSGRNALRFFADKLRSVSASVDSARAEAEQAKTPEQGYRPNRKERRAESHKHRQRTRRTGITQREPARYGWAIHNDANNKALQFINHGLLHSLFSRANVWSNPAP